MLTQYQLKTYADKFLNETYGVKLTVPLKLNGRLKTSKGRFIWSRKSRTPKAVELNKEFVEHNKPEIVLDVLKHELVHYALFIKGVPHSDGQAPFERELRRLGVVSQSTIDRYSIASKMQVYICNSCGREHTFTKRLRDNGVNHRCKCSQKGRLIDGGKRLVVS